MKRVGDRAQEALNAGEWKEFKLLLRFFACLQSLFQDDGVFTFLGQLFDTVVDLQSANENDVSHLGDMAGLYINIIRSSALSLSRSFFSPFLTLLLPEEVGSTNKPSKYLRILGLLRPTLSQSRA